MGGTSVALRCEKGCGRLRYKNYTTCCTRCGGPDGPHAHDCEEKNANQRWYDIKRKYNEYYQHVDSIFPRSYKRLGIGGICKHTVQVNVQITVFGVSHAIVAGAAYDWAASESDLR